MITIKEKKFLYSKLPSELKEKISSNESLEIIESIGSKFNLNEEQKNLLDSEILLVLLGVEKESDFTQNIQKGDLLNDKISRDIYREVSRLMFSTTQTLLLKASAEYRKLLNSNVLQETPNLSQAMDKNLIKNSDNLLEDKKGNADNTLPPLPGQREIASAPTAHIAPTEPAFVPKQPLAQQKPEPAVTDADWEARKKALEAGELVMKTAYGQKPDPYREAV